MDNLTFSFKVSVEKTSRTSGQSAMVLGSSVQRTSLGASRCIQQLLSFSEHHGFDRNRKLSKKYPWGISTKRQSKQKGGISSSWWFQPIWKISVKLDHFPKIGVKIKIFWNHQQPDFLGRGVSLKKHISIHLLKVFHTRTGLRLQRFRCWNSALRVLANCSEARPTSVCK